MTSARRGVAPPVFSTPDDQRVRWPSAFGRRFFVTIDTEEEFDWRLAPAVAPRGVAAIAALPSFHDRLASAGVHPVYLLDWPVVDDEAAAATIRTIVAADSHAGIGAQLHGWVTPPFAGDEAETFAGNLPAELEAAKIARLTARIEAAIGVRPQLFRSGRYGIGAGTIAALAAQGYVADASMRAHFDYSREGGPDFTRVGPGAFQLDAALVELPVTTIYIGLLRRHGAMLHPLLGRVPRGRGVFARTGLLSRVPLSPEGTGPREAIAAIRSAAAAGEPLLQIAFHSPSLVPGNTPYVRDAGDLVRFHRWWDAILPALAAAGYAPATLAAVLDGACQRQGSAAT